MPAPFPHQYRTEVTRTGAARADVNAAPRVTIHGGAPPEFGGTDDVWSPEHMLLGAVGLCLETTFDAFAARDHLVVDSWDVTVEGTVDRTPRGLAFTAISAVVRIGVAPGLTDRAHAVAERAKHCLISSSLRVPVDVSTIVSETDDTDRSAQALRSPPPSPANLTAPT